MTDAAEHFAMGERALANAGEALDSREAEAFVSWATAHFTGGLLAWALTGLVGGVDASIEEITAAHPYTPIALVRALKNGRSSADATAEDPNTKTTHKGVDA